MILASRKICQRFLLDIQLCDRYECWVLSNFFILLCTRKILESSSISPCMFSWGVCYKWQVSVYIVFLARYADCQECWEREGPAGENLSCKVSAYRFVRSFVLVTTKKNKWWEKKRMVVLSRCVAVLAIFKRTDCTCVRWYMIVQCCWASIFWGPPWQNLSRWKLVSNWR